MVAVAVLWGMGTVSTALARVPDLMGLEADVAGEVAAEDGFAIETVLTARGGVAGIVVGQDPGPGEFRRRGAALTVEVTSGARQVRVPDTKGMPVDEARAALEQAGLRMGDVVYRVFEGREPGRVVETDPPAGGLVDEGTDVRITSALG